MIEITDLGKSFGDKIVLNRLNFSVKKGSVYGLLGSNGAGKTTTINILCNLLDADSGKVMINKHEVSGKTKNLLGVAPQEIALYKDLSCRENLLFFGRIYNLSGSKLSAKTDELIHTMKLEEYSDMQVIKLSGGWQRRVNMAIALIHSPSVLILDEPTAGLDIEARYELWNLIASLRETEVTILLTTHQLEEAERLCTCIGILKNGKMVAEGSIAELRNLVQAKQIALIETDSEKALYQRLSSLGWKHRKYGGRLSLLLPNQFTLKEVIDQLDGVTLTSISLQEVGLEHIYLEVTSD